MVERISDLSDLKLFARIIAAGNLSETARRLNSSLPAISRRLAAMEARLGVRLVDRSTRHFNPTEEGNLYYERGVAILAELEELEARVSARSTVPFGHIRVGAPMEIGRRRIAPLIAEFAALYDHVSVELVLTDNRVDVAGDELDVGLHVHEPDDPNIIVRKLISSQRLVCASPKYLEEKGVPKEPRDLPDHSCICLVRGRLIYNRWPFEKDGVREEVGVKAMLLSSSAEVVHDWVLGGHGLALKSQWDIEEDLRAGRLQEVLGQHRGNPINLYATYATRTHLPRRVRLFLDFISSELSTASVG